jgi:menaquinone-9 beta-reductase
MTDSNSFDVVTVGGGMGASALAIAIARSGARDRETLSPSPALARVRGEAVAPWGVAEARELGIADVLVRTCAKEVPFMEMGFGPRNLVETTPQKEPFLTYCHPEMQEALLAEAERAGGGSAARSDGGRRGAARRRINASDGDSAEWRVGKDRSS